MSTTTRNCAPALLGTLLLVYWLANDVQGFVNPVFNRTIKPSGEYFTTHILAHFYDFEDWYLKQNKTFRDIYDQETNHTALDEDVAPFFDRVFRGLKAAAPEMRSFRLHVNNLLFDPSVNSTDEDEVITKLRSIQSQFREHIAHIVAAAQQHNLLVEAFDTYARVQSACAEGDRTPGCRSRPVLDKAFPDHEWHDDDYRLDTVERIGSARGVIQMIYYGGDAPLDVGNHVEGNAIHNILPSGNALTCDELQGKERHTGTRTERKVYAEALGKIKEQKKELRSFTLVCERTVDLNETNDAKLILEMRAAVAGVDQEVRDIVEEAQKLGVRVEHIYEHVNFFSAGCDEGMMTLRCDRLQQLPKAFPHIPLDLTLFPKVFKRDAFAGVGRHLRIL